MDIAATEAATLATARLLFQKFGRDGMNGVADLLDPDCVGSPSFDSPGPLHGREEILAWVDARRARGVKLEARPLGYEVMGTFAIVHGSLRQRCNGALSEKQVYWRFGIRDGSIVSMESFATRDAALADLQSAAA